MGSTMTEQVLARRAGRDVVRPGEYIRCDVDMAIKLDASFAIAGMDQVPKRVADPKRVAVVLDHMVPAPSVQYANAHSTARAFAKEFGIKLFDIGRHGIVHQVLLEERLALPGELLTCIDSHTCAAGAVNCLSRGMGAPEMLEIVCKGSTWFQVPPTVELRLEGQLPDGVAGKDLFLMVAGDVGSVEGYAVEFSGSGIASLTIDDRATIATMCAEISAEFALFPFDKLVSEFMAGGSARDFVPVHADSDAEYAKSYTIDLGDVQPYVALPDSIPNNTVPVSDLSQQRIAVDQAFIGSCANGKLSDFAAAANVLRGRRVASGTRLIVTPASQRVYLEAVKKGYVEVLTEAGAVVTNSTCGACIGGHMGVLGDEESCITSSTRNFKGRMGSPSARIYMGSSATVAASASTGFITDPRSLSSP